MPVGTVVLGPFEDGKLDNDQDRVTLSKPGDKEYGKERYYIAVDTLRYEDELPWPDADGNGRSLQHLHPDATTAGQLYTNDPENWSAALPTPGS